MFDEEEVAEAIFRASGVQVEILEGSRGLYKETNVTEGRHVRRASLRFREI